MKEQLYMKKEAKRGVYELLREQILGFALKPGEKLSENTLAAQLGAARPAVREALTLLAEEGCIVTYPQRGSSVTFLDPDRVRQSVSTHIVLETAVLEECCKRGLSQKQIAELETLLIELKELAKQSQEILPFVMKEQELHMCIASYQEKGFAFELFRSMDCDLIRADYLKYSTYNYREFMSSLSGRENIVVESRLLLDNLKRRDAEASALICANHYNSISWNTDTLLRIYPQFFAGAEQLQGGFASDIR